MKLASEFSVPAPPDKVFPLFFDPETMRGCIPGCEELTRVDESTYRGRLVNEVAHVRFAAGFSAAVQSITDEPEGKEVTAVLKGEDRRLGSSIKIDARLSVRPDGDSTASVIGYEMDMALWGKLGRLGEPIIRRRSREVELEFARSLAIAAGAPAEDLPPSRSAGKAARLLAGRSTANGSTGSGAESAVSGTTDGTTAGVGDGAAGIAVPATDPAIAATRTLAAVATIIAVVALLVAVFGRGR